MSETPSGINKSKTGDKWKVNIYMMKTQFHLGTYNEYKHAIEIQDRARKFIEENDSKTITELKELIKECRSEYQIEIGQRKPDPKIGQVFGRLTVINKGKVESVEYFSKRENAYYPHEIQYYICKCSCGGTTEVAKGSLLQGKTKSCGCLRRDKTKEQQSTLTKYQVEGTTLSLIDYKTQKVRDNNVSGVTGVHRVAKTGKWQAQINLKGQRYYLGSYETKEEAIHARKKGEELVFGPVLDENKDLVEELRKIRNEKRKEKLKS